MGLKIWSNQDSRGCCTAALPMELNFHTTSHTLVRCGEGKKRYICIFTHSL